MIRRVRPISRRVGDRGVTSLELAIFAPVILVLIWLIIQAALYMFALSLASSSANWGANYVRVFPPRGPHAWTEGSRKPAESAITQHTSLFAGTLLKGPGTHVEYNEQENGRVSVTVTGHAVTLLGFNLPQVKKEASASIEQFRSDCPVTVCPDIEGIGGGGG